MTWFKNGWSGTPPAVHPMPLIMQNVKLRKAQRRKYFYNVKNVTGENQQSLLWISPVCINASVLRLKLRDPALD